MAAPDARPDEQLLAQAFAAASPEPILVLTPELRVVAWNWGAELTYQHAASEALGKSVVELLCLPEHRAAAEALHREALTTGDAFGELTLLRRDGKALRVEVFLRAVRRAGQGAVAFLTSAHRNVTEQRHLETEQTEQRWQFERTVEELHRSEDDLRKATRAAEGAARAKAEFLANMSHEIRTPMNAVIGMTSLLMETPLDAQQREFVETIRGSGDHLLSIINDILDFSKIESGKLELESHPFDVRALVEECLDLLAPKAAEKRLDLAYVLDDDVPSSLLGDPSRLKQVLVNLLSNAVKFTGQGEVVVYVTARRIEGDKYEVQFAVRDSGIGISPDRLPRLFTPFTQADASTTRHFGGTGLGLAICKRLCEKMGGMVWAESDPGKGSTFHATIVAPSIVVQRRVAVGEGPALQGKRVLVVDDNATNRNILALQAKRWGMLPRTTASPEEALAWVQRGDPFDLAVLDFHMPAMDGIELGRRIQAVRADLPLVMLSSLGSQGVPAGAGVRFARMLTKPVKQSALYDALMEVLDRVPRPAPTAAAHPSIAAPLPQPGELPALRVLVVEDNLVNQRVAVRLLERLGYKPDLAANGLEALQAVQRQPYDLVFMDLQMPEMDGLEATRRICQAWPAAQRPRIAAMTADALEGDRERCIEAGMDDYLSKPVTLQALAAALRKTPPRTDAPPAPRPVEGPLDLVVLRQLREEIGDDATFRTLVLSYLKEAPRAIGQMWECLARHDARALGRAAHGFKSTSATVGAMSLAAHCKQLEALGAAGSLDGAELRVVEIELGFHPVREALMAQLAPRPAAP